MINAQLLQSVSQSGYITLEATGQCMSEVFSVGDHLRVGAQNHYWPGDIVTFERASGGFVSHRLLGCLPTRRGWRMVTRADLSGREDGTIDRQQLVGRIMAISGKPYRPTLRDRLRALAWLLMAGLRRFSHLLVRRTVSPEGASS
ncbi:MAG: hypothetical protein R3348_08485 [Xanthomonadales bacterium]|nr:hypothetical protein [Xanthomonadales bacterium]